MNLATIVKIKSLLPIEGADRIELAEMYNNAWKVVVKRGDFKINDLGIYFAIDSIVDKSNPTFSFLEQHHYRIKLAKFKKTHSAGLLMPLSILNYYNIDINNLNENDDITELTKTVKFIKEIPAELIAEIKGNFPTSLIPITDELNLLSYPSVLDEFEGKECYLSLKYDGSSGTFIWNNGEFDVCSRRLNLKENELNTFWKIARKYNLKEKLQHLGDNIAIQAECCGNGIQKNPMKLSDLEMRAFTIRNLNTQRYYNLDEMIKICDHILNIPMVKILKIFKFDKNIHTIDWLQDFANKQEYFTGQSAEGIVLRPYYPCYSNILDKQLSIKILNQSYKD